MNYSKVISGKFISRPNRFIARVMLGKKEETVHVKNTGRCRELLIPGVTVYLAEPNNPARKTKYDLIAVDKQGQMVNIDSQAANDIAEEWLRKSDLFSANAQIRREVKFENSRFDFYIEDGDTKAFLEVKGVTLEQEGIALFPDAPTLRGVKHIEELTKALNQGYKAYILFVIQMKGVHLLCPNDTTHKAFGDALRQAAKAGVKILTTDCRVTADTVIPDESIPIKL